MEEIKTIKEARLYAGLTQGQAAAYLEISKRNIENWETEGNNKRKPNEYLEKKIIEDLIQLRHRCKVIRNDANIELFVLEGDSFILKERFELKENNISIELIDILKFYIDRNYKIEFD